MPVSRGRVNQVFPVPAWKESGVSIRFPYKVNSRLWIIYLMRLILSTARAVRNPDARRDRSRL
jgi:hypothetical protein